MTVITVEVAGNAPSPEVQEKQKAARKKEIDAMATSLEEIFLGPPGATKEELDQPEHRKEYKKGYLGLPDGELR